MKITLVIVCCCLLFNFWRLERVVLPKNINNNTLLSSIKKIEEIENRDFGNSSIDSIKHLFNKPIIDN